MARYIDAVKTAEIISEKCGIDISELVDIFAENEHLYNYCPNCGARMDLESEDK